jgi:hypothetical protein
MRAKKFRVAQKKSKQRRPQPLDKLTVTMEAKQVFALVFEGLGGPQGLLDWAKQSTANRGDFYSQYAKLLPMSVVSQVDLKVESGEHWRSTIERQLVGLIEARRAELDDEEARTGVRVLDGVAYKRCSLPLGDESMIDVTPPPQSAEQRQQTAAAPTSPPAAPPHNVTPIRRPAENPAWSIPGLGAGAVLGQGDAGSDLSASEKSAMCFSNPRGNRPP